MIDWSNTTTEDINTIVEIARRTGSMILVKDTMRLIMDIKATHNKTPLDLVGLLSAESGKFLHDVCGISNHINRKTGEPDGCFASHFTASVFNTYTL